MPMRKGPVAASVVLAVLVLPTTSQASESKPSDTLTLDLAVRQERYSVAEPVVLTATFVNNSTSPVSAYFCAHPACEVATLWYRKIPHPFTRYQRPVLKGTYQGREYELFDDIFLTDRPLAPGTSAAETIVVAVDGSDGGPVLGMPGRYEFKIEYREAIPGRDLLLSSNVVRVQAVPAVASERGALTDYRRLAAFVHNPWLSPGQLGAAVDFLAKHGESLYEPHVRSAALAFLRSKINSTTATQDERDLYLRLTGAKR